MSAPARRSLAGLAIAALLTAGAIQAIGAWSRDRLGGEVAAAARPGDIAMIGSVDCVYCAAARDWFAAHRVPYTECQIERDPVCAAAYQALSAPGTPLMLVRGKRLLGFDPRAVADALRPL